MSDLDADAVQATAAGWHRIDCLPFARPGHPWSREHQRQDEGKAVELLTGLAEGGYRIVPFGEAQ